jgi:hypothetical protein
MIASFAVWQGFIAIELFGCERARWVGVRAVCATDIDPLQESTWLLSGAVQGTLILIAAAGVLIWLWVLPSVRRVRMETRSQRG